MEELGEAPPGTTEAPALLRKIGLCEVKRRAKEPAARDTRERERRVDMKARQDRIRAALRKSKESKTSVQRRATSSNVPRVREIAVSEEEDTSEEVRVPPSPA